MPPLNILVTAPSEAVELYRTHLATQAQFMVRTVASDAEARTALAGQEKRADMLIVDNAHSLEELYQSNPAAERLYHRPRPWRTYKQAKVYLARRNHAARTR